ncbi:MAG: tetratricopeptide repeat protein [bacterium]|nr:tetratricopeptide repeat protein [bacterium]
MRTVTRLSPLLLSLLVLALPVRALAGQVVHMESGASTISLPSDPTVIERDERRADGGDVAGAISDLQLYTAAHPDQRGPIVLLGDLYYRSRNLAQAEHAYRDALALGDLREIHNKLGGVYALQKRYDEAIREFRASLPLPSGFIHLIALHRVHGDMAAFLAQTQTDADRHPSNADYALDLALVYDALGHNDEALTAYHHVLDLQPNSAAAYNGIGSVLISEQRYSEALLSLRQALSFDGRFVAALNNIGDAYLGLKDTASARKYLERALAVDPESASVLVNLGVLADIVGNRAAALANYRRAIASDPFQVEAYYNMAADYDADGQHELAEAVTLKGLAIDASDGILHFNLAVIDDEMGRHQEALKEYHTAARLSNPQAAHLAKLALSVYEKQAAPTIVR